MNKKVKRKMDQEEVIELVISEDELSSGVSAIALVDEPAIEKYWIAMKNEQVFVDPRKGEKKTEFIPRCMKTLVGDEDYDTDQAAAICYTAWRSAHPEDKMADDKDLEDVCDEGYTAYGLKELNGRMVPNCVPDKENMDLDPSALPPYIDPGVKPKKHAKVNNPVNPAPDGKKIRRVFEDDARHQLKSMLAIHNETYKLEHQKCTYSMLKQVYNRAVSAMDMEARFSSYTKRQAGLTRCKHFLHMLAKGKYITKAYQGLDNDLLPEGHRLKNVKSKRKMFALEEDKHILVGPAMIPDFKIFRKDENGDPYYVVFSRDTIFKIQEKFMRELRNRDTNLQHHDTDYAHSFVFESWIVEDPDKDKANLIYNLGVPVGTWMVKMKVDSDKVWADVKAGKYKGFSIEGEFMDGNSYEIDIKDEKELYEKIKKILENI